MARLSPQFLDTLRSRITLSSQVSQHVKLARAGREYRACCPFHAEKTPSFYVNDEKGFYHCFGCGAHGDVIGFLMQMTGQDFMTVVTDLATIAGLELPKTSPAEGTYRHGDLHTLLDAAAGFFQDCLGQDQGRQARTMIRERGIDDQTAKTFRLGYAPADDSLITFLCSKGFDENRQVSAGIAKPSTRRAGHYSFFRNRLIFPICDQRGRVVGFGGRSLDGQEPKYINSPETPIFAKGQQLFGLNLMDRSVRRPIMIVEGYMDVIASVKHGFSRVLAPLGTAVTPQHLTMLWRYGHADEQELNAPVACFDGDAAGQRAARRLASTALAQLEPGRSVRFAFLPKGEDPDSLLSQAGGRETLHAIIDQAIDLVDFVWLDAVRNGIPRTPETRAKLRVNLASQADLIPDRTIKELYSATLMRQFFQACRPSGERPSSIASPQSRERKPTPWPQKRYVVLLSMLLNAPELWRSFADNLEVIDWHDAYCRSIFHLAAQMIDQVADEETTITAQELHDKITTLDPSLVRALARLREVFVKHSGPQERLGQTFKEGLKQTQQERLRNDYRDTLLRLEQEDSEHDRKRISFLMAEIEKILNEQNYMVTDYTRKFVESPDWLEPTQTSRANVTPLHPQDQPESTAGIVRS
ncbi:MAG: DNA primase [Pseudomonadota bacterium]